MTKFREGCIQGIMIRVLQRYTDHRGWLVEIFRSDEVDSVYAPAMSYISMTNPGVARGPHEHRDQSDWFCFLGPSTFKLYLWDARKESPTHGVRQVFQAGEDDPMSVIIPPGVVHAYKNVGSVPGMVVNLPNRLFKGSGRTEPVDEIRHENDPNTIYVLD